MRVGGCPEVWQERWLRCFAHPLGGIDMLLLLQPLWKKQLGFLVSLCLLSRICLNCACMQLFLVPYSFFVFCCSKRGMSRCKLHCPKGSQVLDLSHSRPHPRDCFLFKLFLFFLFLIFLKFILCLVALDLCCRSWTFSSCG